MRDTKTLLYWISEREAIRHRKERGAPWPWTDDPIMRYTRFTNVRREDDTVTRWIRRNIREPYATDPNLWVMLAIARMVNYPFSLAELMTASKAWPNTERFDPAAMGRVLTARADRGEKVFGGAYTIPSVARPHLPGFGWKKPRQVAEVFIAGLWRDRVKFWRHFADGEPTLRRTTERLMSYQGFADFMAYQCVVDLRYTPFLDRAPDIETWAAAGPGTRRGLNRLHGRNAAFNLSQRQALIEMREVHWLVRKEMPKAAIDFSDIPNCLCEYSKYKAIKLGEAKPRNRYRPGASPRFPDIEPIAEAAE